MAVERMPAADRVMGRSPVPAGTRSVVDERADVPTLAERFMSELSKTVRRTPAPLPMVFQPMAEAVAGTRQVMLSTDASSRRALRSVGKVAATTGDTIHLDMRPTPSARLDEVIAHELTHIANPSPVPRFFADSDQSPEERQADRVAAIMARSPLAPTASVVAPGAASSNVSGRTTPTMRAGGRGTVRRSSSPGPARPHATPGTLSADALAAQLSGAASSSSGHDTISRWATGTPTAAGPTIGGHRGAGSASDAHRSAPEPPVVQSSASLRVEEVLDSDHATTWFDEQLSRRIESLLRLVEDRMIIEMERRGGRFWGAS